VPVETPTESSIASLMVAYQSSSTLDSSNSLPINSWSKNTTRAVWLIGLIGAIFRLMRWFHWRSLWLDEIMLSYSIIHRGWHELLFKSLAYWQGAPVGFLAAVKTCTIVFGSGERALRLPSLLAALVSLPLFIGVIRRTLSPRGGILAIALFAILPPIVYYAQEVKQYGFDIMATLAVTYTAIRVVQDGHRRRAMWVYFVTGAAALFLSHAVIFALTGTGLTVAARQLLHPTDVPLSKRLKSLVPFVAIGAGWVLFESANYHFFLSMLSRGQIHAGLVKYWEERSAFMPRSPTAALVWIATNIKNIISGYSTMWITVDQIVPVACLCGLLGLAALWKHRRWELLLLLTPIPLAMLASLVRKYPFAERLVLWTVPALAILIAGGLDYLCRKGIVTRLLFTILTVLIFYAPLTAAWWQTSSSANGGREESKPIYQYIASHWQWGDTIYLYHSANLSFYYYSQQPDVNLVGLKPLQMRPWSWGNSLPATVGGPPGMPGDSPYGGWPDRVDLYPRSLQEYPEASGAPAAGDLGYYIVQGDHGDNPADYGREIDNLKHPPADWHWPPIRRVWVVFTHVWPATQEDADERTLRELDHRLKRLQPHPFHATGASVYLYDISGVTTAP